MGKSKKVQQVRLDRKHRFPLRIGVTTHNEVEAISFRQNLSLNLLYCEAIEFALDNQNFLSLIQEKFKRDERRGHFVYHQDTMTLRRGRMIE